MQSREILFSYVISRLDGQTVTGEQMARIQASFEAAVATEGLHVGGVWAPIESAPRPGMGDPCDVSDEEYRPG